MKVYTEVIWQWCEKAQKMIELSSKSEDYYGEVALCYCGSYKGNDKAGAQDKEAMGIAKGGLEDILHQYKKGSDPFDSFYANEIERMQKMSAEKQGETEDRFNLMKDQKQSSFQMAKAKGALSYDQTVAGTKKDLARMQTKATKQAEGMRADMGGDQYSMGLAQGRGGMAGTGSRASRMMAERAKRTIGGVGLQLAQAKDDAKENLRDAEATTSLNVSEQAMGLSQANEAAEQEMSQQKANLNREQESFEAKMLQEQSGMMDSLRSEARGTIASTSTSFMNPNSKWGSPGGVDSKFDGGGFEPNWYKPFDEWDEEQGLDTGWSDSHG